MEVEVASSCAQDACSCSLQDGQLDVFSFVSCIDYSVQPELRFAYYFLSPDVSLCFPGARLHLFLPARPSVDFGSQKAGGFFQEWNWFKDRRLLLSSIRDCIFADLFFQQGNKAWYH
ncbi:UNVERIFIED_CONTAM: hypothetical protein K2H54_038747 [Gekko kuhli]